MPRRHNERWADGARGEAWSARPGPPFCPGVCLPASHAGLAPFTSSPPSCAPPVPILEAPLQRACSSSSGQQILIVFNFSASLTLDIISYCIFGASAQFFCVPGVPHDVASASPRSSWGGFAPFLFSSPHSPRGRFGLAKAGGEGNGKISGGQREGAKGRQKGGLQMGNFGEGATKAGEEKKLRKVPHDS